MFTWPYAWRARLRFPFVLLECDKTHFLRVQAARDHQLGIAHRLVADAAPREEVI